MNETLIKYKLLGILITIKNDPNLQYGGICGIIYRNAIPGEEGNLCDLFNEISTKWEHFSGSYSFPIPTTYGEKSVERAEIAYGSIPKECFWDEHLHYGRLRRDLLDFAIKSLIDDLEIDVDQ